MSSKTCWNPGCARKEGRNGRESVKLKKCSRCQTAHYCSRDCLRKHWKDHKKDCPSLQSKKLENDVNKTSRNLKEPMAMSRNDVADAAAAAMARHAARMAESETDPRRRQAMEQFSRDMNEAVEEEIEKKRRGEIDTSWLHDGAECRKRDAAAEAYRAQTERMGLQTGERGVGLNRGMMMEVMNDLFDEKGQKRSIEEIERRRRERLGSISPERARFRRILEYVGPCGGPPAPANFQDMLDRIKQVLEDLCEWIHTSDGAGADFDADGTGRKLSKLSKNVKKMETLGPEDRAKYSQKSLMTIQTKWRNQVAEIQTGVMGGLMATTMAGGGL